MLLAIAALALAAAPAHAATSADPWPQFQGDAGRAGFAEHAPASPYEVAWEASTGIGDATQVSGLPIPIIAGTLAIVVGREEVAAVDIAAGTVAWTAPRALGPSSPPAVAGELLLFLEGGGDESASASGTPSASSSASATPSVVSGAPDASRTATASATPAPAATVSSVVAIDLRTRERAWTVALSEVSHTGVLLEGGTAFVGADDGTITAVNATNGSERWSVDVGDHVTAPIAASDGLVLASVRPETREAPSLVALRAADGSEAWRYGPSGTVLDLGAPSVAGDAVYLVASDSTVRAVGLGDGAERWASPLYSPSAGSPPAVSGQGVFVTDQSGTIYNFDPASGAERWRYASNRFAVSGPIVTSTALLQPTSDGTIVAVDIASGHQVWHGSVSDSLVIGLAASSEVVVASRTGTSPGLVGLRTDPAGLTEDVTSPTTSDPAGLLLAWLAASVPIVALAVLLGRSLYRRMGPADLGGADVDDIVDPWESDPEDQA